MGHVTGKTPGARAMRRRRWVSTGVKFANGGLAAHDPRRSARGRRLNLPTCAHLYIYIYIYTRLASIASLFFIPLSSGVVVATPLPETRRWWCGATVWRGCRRLRLLSAENLLPPRRDQTRGRSSPRVPRPLPLPSILLFIFISCAVGGGE